MKRSYLKIAIAALTFCSLSGKTSQESEQIGRALGIVKIIFCSEHPIEKSFRAYCEDILQALADVPSYDSFSNFIRSIQSFDNPIEIARAFNAYKKQMPAHIRKDLQEIERCISKMTLLIRFRQLISYP